ncbi:MAG: DUF3368 domain-containing protein [bacterium]|nr:DUF3368 domain-containing protein [bacterium]
MNLQTFSVISNTTPIIALSAIDELELVQKLFNEITIAEAVLNEINVGGTIEVPAPESIEWIKIKPNVSDIKEKLLFDLDEGEKQTILIAIEMHEYMKNKTLLLIDERKGRKIATTLGFRIKGTLGILAEAKKRGLIQNFKKLAFKLLDKDLYYDLKLIDAIALEVDR